MENTRIEVGQLTGTGWLKKGAGIIVREILIPRANGGYDRCACTGYIVKMDSGEIEVIAPEQILSIL